MAVELSYWMLLAETSKKTIQYKPVLINNVKLYSFSVALISISILRLSNYKAVALNRKRN